MSVWKRIVQTPNKKEKTIRMRVEKTITYHEMRRVMSEIAIEKNLPWHFEAGVTYHVLSYGDVDSLTYLRLIVKQQHIRYAFVTSWALAETDAIEMIEWMEKGYIDRLDFYVGDIVFNTKPKITNMLYAAGKKFGCKIALLKNHSKIICAFGDLFDVVVESSANLNTNPRIEQSVITRDTKLALFYKNFFDSFTPFNIGYDQPPNYKFGDERDDYTNGQTENDYSQ